MPVKESKANSSQMKALVTNVSEGGMKDIVVSLDGKRGIYYISNTSKKSLTANNLATQLLNKEVQVSYIKPRAFTLFSPMTNTIKITEIKVGNDIVFSEFN